jgi:multiple sugar transport system permease protein
MKRAGFYLLLLSVCLFCLGPFLWQVITSVKPPAELTKLPPIMPHSPTLDSYRAVFTMHPLTRLLLNSTIVAVASTLLSLMFGSLAAFALVKLNVKRASLILIMILAISMLPPISTVSPLYEILRALRLRDSLLALVLIYTTFSLPLTIWILSNFIRSIPDELFSASRVDGCTPWQSFYKILLPLAAPGMAATAILVFIFCWNEFLFALTFTSTLASRTVPVGIALFPGLHEVPYGEMAAASVIVTIPLVILVFVFQKRIVQGLTAGAIKE